MSYLSTLVPNQLSNIYTMVGRMDKFGITNNYAKAAILAVVSKESGFIPKSETSYKNTSNKRIREIFGTRVPSDDASLDLLKRNDESFFNAVYGGRYGNSPTEGYKYRGRGYNQLTFKGNYESVAKLIKTDIVSNPDLVNKPDVAADVMIAYFLREFNSTAGKLYLSSKGIKDINDFKSTEEALNAIFQANRGWGKTGPDTTGGYALAASRVDDLIELVGNIKKKK